MALARTSEEPSKRRAYNTSGDLGIQLVLRSGKRILVGTQDPDGFMAGVAEARRHFGGGRAARRGG